jgi:hypothetical protein
LMVPSRWQYGQCFLIVSISAIKISRPAWISAQWTYGELTLVIK